MPRVTAVVMLALVTLAVQPTGDPLVILHNGRLIDGTGRGPVEDAVVVIQGHRIVSVGRWADVQMPTSALRVDVNGGTILPGLIESNAHIVFSGQTHHGAYHLAHVNRYYELGAHNLHTNLMQGITTVRDTMGPLDPLIALRTDSELGKIAAARLFTGGTILNYPVSALRDGSPQLLPFSAEAIRAARRAFILDIRDPAHGRAVVRELAARGADFVKVSADTDQKQPPPLTAETLTAIVEEAHRAGLPVDSHTLSAQSLRAVLRAGVDSIQHPQFMHPSIEVEIPDDVLAQMAQQNVYAVPVIVAREVYVKALNDPALLDRPSFAPGAPADLVEEGRAWLRAELEKDPTAATERTRRYGVARRSLQKLIAAGVPIALGTDKGTQLNFHESNNTIRELEIYVELGMTPMEAIATATRRGAELLRQQSQLGTIEAGKLADVIVVEGDPLADIGALRNIRMVFKNGKRYK